MLTILDDSADVYTGEIVLNTDGKDSLNTSKLAYYTDYRSSLKKFFIENFAMTELEQEEPYGIKTL